MRTLDHTFLQQIANDPRVRPALGNGNDLLDLSGYAFNPNIFMFVHEDKGGFVVLPVHGTRYEIHTIFYPRTNAKLVLDGVRQLCEYMFTKTDCEEIVTKVADNNLGALFITKKSLFQEQFRREDAWEKGVGLSYWSFTLDTWARTCSTAKAVGEKFLENLENTHSGEDYIAGAMVMMAKNGQAAKGVDFYNSWALFVGVAPCRIHSLSPALLTSHGRFVEVSGNSMEFY